MGRKTPTLNWVQVTVPVIHNGGRFPMVPDNAELKYLSLQTVALHLHDYTGKLWIGERTFNLQPGDFTLTPAGMVSCYDLERAGNHLCMHFSAPVAVAGDLRLPLHWRPGAHERWLSERIQEIIHLHRKADAAGGGLAEKAAGTALQSLLLWLAVTVKGQLRTGKRLSRVDEDLDRVRGYLDEHFRAPIAVPALARQFGVSQNYLAQRFRTRHGMTIQRYLLSRRVELARHLLTVTQLPLKAVAIEAGLGNPQYFHRQYLQATGRSPSQDRAQAIAAALPT